MGAEEDGCASPSVVEEQGRSRKDEARGGGGGAIWGVSGGSGVTVECGGGCGAIWGGRRWRRDPVTVVAARFGESGDGCFGRFGRFGRCSGRHRGRS